LTTGDEIDVPRKASPFEIDNKNTAIPIENKLAAHVVAGASILSNGDAAKSGERMVRSAASNEFNNSAQQWLSQLGTARVQLNVNDDFHLDSSAADVLFPLSDNEKSILFVQLGARNKDSRNTVNIGAGGRTFQNGWMYGVNTFFDNDITGQNKRLGIGAEAWADYLKLSANSYFGLTDWHQSRDFSDYNERPANGYDLRAEAWLPSYPQLGGKVMYDKYSGGDVALFGKDNRQKAPHTITANVNYTPIPLMTVGVEHRAGKGGQNDSNINLQLNYRLGESWQFHISPSAVAVSRMLVGSRYDLVERNNNIVLDYQKQDLIQLSLPASLSGEAHSMVTVNAQVTAKYGFDHMDWDSATLATAGEVINKTSPHSVEIILPKYQANANRATGNNYTLNAVAYDTKGNASNQATVLITVNPQDMSTTNSTLVAAPVNIEANGTDTSVETLTLKDSNNNPVTGQTMTFASTLGTLGGVTESAGGVYSATLTAGAVAGLASVTVDVDGSALGVTPATVTLNGNSRDLSTTNSTLVASPLAIVANNNDTAVVTLTLKDSNNNPVTGQTVTFASTLGTLGGVTESTGGVYSATLTAGAVAGLASVSVNVGGSAFGVTGNVTLAPGAMDVARSILTVNKLAINADDRTGSTITFTPRDAQGNAITGLDIAFTTDLADSQITTVVDHNNGTYTANINGTKTGIANIAVQSSGTTVTGLTATTVAITPGAWNVAQATPVMTITQPTTACALSSGVYKRYYIGITGNKLYDNHGNEIAGTLTYNLGPATLTTVTSQRIPISGNNGLTRSSNGSTTYHMPASDAYASQALCDAERIVSTNVTVTVIGITDNFKTSTVNKIFTLP
jgi:adhesin/invasin